MKIGTSRKIHYDAGPNMTPLVDIVMVILIFLMLTGTFAVGEHYLQSNLPMTKRGAGAPANPNVPQDEPLDIRVDSVTRPGSDGLSQDVWYAQAGPRVTVQNSRADLAAKLTRLHEELNKAGTPTSKIQVVISPGRATKYKHLIEVYEAALEAKFTKVAFAPAH